MNDRNDRLDELMRAVGRGAAPVELRARTLERALGAWDCAAPADRWRRAWESRPLRVAWAAAVVALVAANLALDGTNKLASQAAPAQAASTNELDEATRLPRLRLSYVGIDASASPKHPAPHPVPAAGTHGKESRS
jgi:anti-sigma-K factor RskA